MTAAERREFEKLIREAKSLFELRAPGQFAGAFFILLLFGVIGFLSGTLTALLFFLASKVIPAAAFLSAPPAVKALQAGGALFGIFGLPLLLWAATKKTRESRARLFEQDLAEGTVEEVRVTASAAVRRELNGEEQLFFIETGDSEVLFLCGEYLVQPFIEEKFPSTEFQFVRGVKSRMIIGLQCLGKPLAAREVFYEWDGDCRFPMDGDFLGAGLDGLENFLKKKSGSPKT